MKHCNIESMGKGKPNFDFDTYKNEKKFGEMQFCSNLIIRESFGK